MFGESFGHLAADMRNRIMADAAILDVSWIDYSNSFLLVLPFVKLASEGACLDYAALGICEFSEA